MKKNLLPIVSNWWLSGGASIIASKMDLINLQSKDATKFTIIPTNKISAWAEESGTLWSQGTDLNRPLLTSGVPTFDGSNDQLIRSSELNLGTQFSLYFVFKDIGAITKILAAAQSASDYIMHDSPSSLYDRIQIATGGVTRQGWVAGLTGNRKSILSIRRNGNTVTAKINDRTLLVKTANFAGQSTTISRLMGFTSGGFNMAGTLEAVCASSEVLSDADDVRVINELYSNYNLSSDTAIETIFGFGDSNMVGNNVTPFLRALAVRLSVADCNLGQSGTRLSAFNQFSGVARWSAEMATRPATDYVVIQYGTNDALAGVSSTIVGDAMNTVVTGLLSLGYLASRICICSNPYQRDGLNATLLDQYATAFNNIASTSSTKWYDFLNDMRNNGGNTLLQPADNVHINSAGQTMIENGVYTALTT